MRTASLLRASAGAVVLVAVVSACGAPTATAPHLTTAAAPAAAPRSADNPLAIATCADALPATASIRPEHDEQWYLQNGPTLKKIKSAKRLIVGTSGDVLLGCPYPEKGDLEGYDIDLLKLIAGKIGVPITYKVINYAQRLPSLENKQVDIVAHTMTINCTRWKDILFSSEYYRAGQKVLVRYDPIKGPVNGPAYKSVEALKGKRICVANGSTNLGNIKSKLGADAKLVTVDDLGECLVKFQQGEADAITGDDTVLAGFQAQDPYSAVVGLPFSAEPYGLGFNKVDKDFVQFVNVLLDGWRKDGTLQSLYDVHMKKAVPNAPPIPTAIYGRTGNTGRRHDEQTMQMTSTGTPRVAPEAPGRLGYAIPAEALLPYLAELDKWRAERRQELDRIDAAALRSTDSSSYTNDITLAMAIWQSVTERWERLSLLWDGARADERAREEMSRVIWGSGPVPGAGPAPAGMGLSLVEATRLSDALTTSLRSRLSFDPVAADVAARLAAVRAGLQRCDRLLPSTMPSNGGSAGTSGSAPDLESYHRRLDSVTKTASEGGDVLGPLQFLEADVARAERDLIVSTATHRELSRDFRSALTRRAELSAEGGRIRALAATCAAQVTPIPRLAVPDVESLGRVPQSRAELDAYRAKLDLVARALSMVRDAYAEPLADRDELRTQLGVLTTSSKRFRAGPFEAALSALLGQAQAVLDETPSQLRVAKDLVKAVESVLSAAEKYQPGSRG